MTILGASETIPGKFWDKGGAVVNVMHPDFGAKGDGSTDDSRAIQDAIDTGLTVYFPVPSVSYKCVGLTQSTTGQVLVAQGGGAGHLVKNGSGVLLASTGQAVQIVGLGFRGDASTPTYTGDNVTFAGANCALINCGSRWAYGRAVKATGGHFQIIGTCDVYQTAGATGSDYDIELGVSGTATLYHELHGVYTSQPTGGILMTDVGGVSIIGGQIGKLYIKAGTLPAGVGVNKVLGTRITGATTVEISNTIMTGVVHSAVAITFAAATSGCIWDGILASGGTITNNGNVSNKIIRETSVGSTSKILYGPDTSKALMEMDNGAAGDGHFRFPSVRVPNNIGLLVVENAAAGSAWDVSANASGDVFDTTRTSGRTKVITVTGAGGNCRVDTNAGTGTFKVSDTIVSCGLSLQQKAVPITYSASMTPDASLGNIQTITATNGTAFAINAPTNPLTGTRITFITRNTSGGALGAITPNAVFKLAGSAWPTPATGFSRALEVQYDGTNWVELSRGATDVPN